MIESAYHTGDGAFSPAAVRVLEDAGVSIPRNILPTAPERIVRYDPVTLRVEFTPTAEPQITGAFDIAPPELPEMVTGEGVTLPSDETRIRPQTAPEPLTGDSRGIREVPHVEVRTQVGVQPPGDETFFGINEARMDAIIKETAADVNGARYASIMRAGGMHREIIDKARIFYESGTYTLTQAIDMATKEIMATGLNAVRYSDGRRVPVRTYVEMVLRTNARRAGLMADGARRDALGIHTVISPVLHSTCDTCLIWQGVVLIDDVYARGKPDGKHKLLSEAIEPPSHFLGPNCRHPIRTYIEGVTQVPTKSDLDKTREQYAAEQSQRYIERQIRKHKILAATRIDEAEAKQHDAHVRAWQAKMRQHLKQHPQLRRKPERELVDIPAGETA